MRKTPIALALMATLVSFTPVVHADVTYSFSSLALAGFEFANLSTLVGPFSGTLTSVSVNATLDASVNYTYADDLTIYVSSALVTGGPLQIGGYSDLSATSRYSWANGGSSAPGTTVIDTVLLSTPLTFSGSTSINNIYLGNGYGASDTEGTWSGSVTLKGISVAAVPEPSSLALLALGGLGIAGWAKRRQRATTKV